MKIKKALGFVSEKYKDPSVCESCGDQFVCGATIKGCWCMKVELTDNDRERLKSKFKNCLCPKCLDNIASIA